MAWMQGMAGTQKHRPIRTAIPRRFDTPRPRPMTATIRQLIASVANTIDECRARPLSAYGAPSGSGSRRLQ